LNGSIKSYFPISAWLPKYEKTFLRWDLIAGITLASFVLPESMAYATLAGVPTYFGIYCCLAGGLFFAIFTTSKQVAVGPTSSISLMIGATVAVLSGGDPIRWAAIAGLTALLVGAICFIAYFLKLSSIVNFISDSILLGFKAGAALSIMSSQLPKLFGVEGGGRNFFGKIWSLFEHIPDTNMTVLVFGITAMAILIVGERLFRSIPVSLFLVIVSILVMSFTSLASAGVHIAGVIPSGLPSISRPSLHFRDVDGVLALAFACFLMGYIETISAARTFAMKNNYLIDPQQELLSMGAANVAAAFASAYVVSGGLSQSTVNDKSGAKTPMALIICSATLGVILLFLTGLLKNLPEVILAVIVIHAVSGLIKVKELKKIYNLSRTEFTVAMIAVGGVLVFGILKGVMISVIMSLVILIRRTSNPEVAELGRIGDTDHFSDAERHTDNVIIPGTLVVRVESSILYFNAENILEKINHRLSSAAADVKLVVIDLSAAPYVDVAGSAMLLNLGEVLEGQGKKMRIVQALSSVRDILRKQGLERITGHISRSDTIAEAVAKSNRE
jgi:high affinity sulfate transporter 1